MAQKQGPQDFLICKSQVRDINVFSLHKDTKGVEVLLS